MHYAPKNLTDLDKNLLDDIANDDCNDWQFDLVSDDHDNYYHVIFSPSNGRGGAVLIGQGSSGQTFWTDASDLNDVFNRVINDDLIK